MGDMSDIGNTDLTDVAQCRLNSKILRGPISQVLYYL